VILKPNCLRPRFNLPIVKKRIFWIALAAAVSLAIALCLLFEHPEPPSVLLLPEMVSLKYNPLPDRWIPAKWGWLWRMRDFLLGKRLPVSINAQFVRLSDSALQTWQRPVPALATHNLQIWILDATHLAGLQKLLSATAVLLASPNSVTANGIQARLFVGKSVPINGGFSDAGLSIDVLPRVQKHRTDLALIMKLTEAAVADDATKGGLLVVQTNLMTAIRAQIPIGNGLFIVKQESALQPAVAIILSVQRK